jgi:superfamily II DNA or RNA helicase
MFDLRQHQENALLAISNMSSDKGRVVIPTGGGKTLVEAYTLRDVLNNKQNGIHVVLAPRIALVNQLIKEYRNFIGQSYIALAFHSGKHEPDWQKVPWAERSTTHTEVVDEEISRAQTANKSLIIFSTYASVHKLKKYNFETLIADESQYCVAENFFESVRDIKAVTKLFFTATEKHTPTTAGRGLNNTTVFGDVLFQVTPQELIAKGYIVAPRLHMLYGEVKSESYTVIDEVVQIAKAQSKLSENLPVTKVLYAMKGTDDVKNIVENISKIKERLKNDFKIFTIVSNNKYGAMVDGVKMARGDFMKILRETDHALIFHYDILSEGIDVDGITGVAILRNMTHSKLLQTIGRAVRVYKADPSAKKQAWISVVGVNGNDESIQNVGRTVNAIREGGFEVNIEDVEYTDADGYGISDMESDLDNVVSPDTKSKAQGVLEQVIHKIEEDEEAQQLASNESESLFADISDW